jgi:hypothetical protein
MATTRTLFHSGLTPNTPYPLCHHISDPYKGPLCVTGTPGPQSSPVHSRGTQYRATLRQIIGTGNALSCCKGGGSTSILTPSTLQPLIMTRFNIRVAHTYYPPFEAGNNAGNQGEGEGLILSSLPCGPLVVPPNGKNRPQELRRVCMGRRVTPFGGSSPLIISNDDADDDMVSISELFARTDPAPTAATTTATPTAGTNISIPLLHLAYLALYEQQRVLKTFPSIV